MSTRTISISFVLLSFIIALATSQVVQSAEIPLTAQSDECIIPPSGPWPPCATGGNGGGGSDNCVIPPSGPWPPCATGGGNSGGGGTGGGGNNCVIPPSGPWPPCATGGGSGTGTGVQVQSFAVPSSVIGGDSITLRWNVSGTNASLVLVQQSNNGTYTDITRHTVRPSGELTVQFATTDEDFLTFSHDFWLELDGNRISETKNVTINCSYQWFFLPQSYNYDTDPHNIKSLWGHCASQPQLSQASQQQFEHGIMIWVAELNQIWVYTHTNKRLNKFTDTYQNGVDPVSMPGIVPPAGLLQPEYGFGKVWRNNPDVREGLGWAVSQPINFETVDQGNGRDFRNLQRFLRLANGDILLHDNFVDIVKKHERHPQLNGFAHPNNGLRLAQPEACVIPPSGPWPPCATGG